MPIDVCVRLCAGLCVRAILFVRGACVIVFGWVFLCTLFL
jgi:hypothetical protein